MVTEITTNVREKRRGSQHTKSFLVSDIESFIRFTNPDSKIIRLTYGYKSDKSDFEPIIEKYKDNDNVVVCTTAYISTVEYPQDLYYLDKPEDNKLPLPVDYVLNRGSKLLTELGFIDVNDFVQYEYQVAFIYPNKLGQYVIDEMNKLVNK